MLCVVFVFRYSCVCCIRLFCAFFRWVDWVGLRVLCGVRCL